MGPFKNGFPSALNLHLQISMELKMGENPSCKCEWSEAIPNMKNANQVPVFGRLTNANAG